MKSKAIKKINPLWLILSGVATIGVIYGAYSFFTKEKKQADFSTTDKGNSNGFCKYFGFPLRLYSCGNDVKDLQRYLNIKTLPPRAPLKVDGKFGNKTLAALKRIAGISTVSQSQFNQFKSQLNPFTQSR